MKFYLLVIIVSSQNLFMHEAVEKKDSFRKRRSESEGLGKDFFSLLAKYNLLPKNNQSKTDTTQAKISPFDRNEKEESENIEGRILKGFENEKVFIRNTLDTVKESQSSLKQNVQESINQMKVFVSDTINNSSEQITNIEASLDSKIMQLDTQIKDELVGKIETIKEDADRHLDSLEIQLKVCNDKVTSLENNLQTLIGMFQCETAGWEYYNYSCYLFIRETVSWEDAKVACEDLNAHLVEIDSAAENDYLLAKWNDAGLIAGFRGPWIGLSDIANEGDFVWVNSGRMLIDTGFQDWGGAEPNGKTKENCVHKASWMSGWNDQRCTLKTTYTCERPLRILV